VALLEGYGLNAWEKAGLPFAGKHMGMGDAEALTALRELDLRRPSLSPRAP
jgi:hypothetical protein